MKTASAFVALACEDVLDGCLEFLDLGSARRLATVNRGLYARYAYHSSGECAPLPRSRVALCGNEPLMGTWLVLVSPTVRRLSVSQPNNNVRLRLRDSPPPFPRLRSLRWVTGDADADDDANAPIVELLRVAPLLRTAYIECTMDATFGIWSKPPDGDTSGV
jgi:hypothetical protein